MRGAGGRLWIGCSIWHLTLATAPTRIDCWTWPKHWTVYTDDESSADDRYDRRCLDLCVGVGGQPWPAWRGRVYCRQRWSPVARAAAGGAPVIQPTGV